MVDRERWDWERDHSPFTPEGQIEAAAAFGRGLVKYRIAFGRVLLGLAGVCAVLVVVALVR